MEDAVQTVMTQCELWTDNYNFGQDYSSYLKDDSVNEPLPLAAEEINSYN